MSWGPLLHEECAQTTPYACSVTVGGMHMQHRRRAMAALLALQTCAAAFRHVYTTLGFYYYQLSGVCGVADGPSWPYNVGRSV